jgi:signal transduction histidine kinase
VLKDNVQVQNDNLNDINNTKNKLFKIIAHDLKNPLSSIEALTDLMRSRLYRRGEGAFFKPNQRISDQGI